MTPGSMKATALLLDAANAQAIRRNFQVLEHSLEVALCLQGYMDELIRTRLERKAPVIYIQMKPFFK